jgi:hypothetical protein
MESLKRKDISEEVGVDGRIILKWIFRKYGLNSLGSGYGPVASSFVNTVMNLRIS